MFGIDSQDVAALGLVLAAIVYLTRRFWARTQSAGGCGSGACHGCPTGVARGADVVQIGGIRKMGPPVA